MDISVNEFCVLLNSWCIFFYVSHIPIIPPQIAIKISAPIQWLFIYQVCFGVLSVKRRNVTVLKFSLNKNAEIPKRNPIKSIREFSFGRRWLGLQSCWWSSFWLSQNANCPCSVLWRSRPFCFKLPKEDGGFRILRWAANVYNELLATCFGNTSIILYMPLGNPNNAPLGKVQASLV